MAERVQSINHRPTASTARSQVLRMPHLSSAMVACTISEDMQERYQALDSLWRADAELHPCLRL